MAYHQGTRQIHRLEPAASKVFSLCDGKTLRSEAANIAFPEESNRLDRLEALLLQMEEKGLIECDLPFSSGRRDFLKRAAAVTLLGSAVTTFMAPTASAAQSHPITPVPVTTVPVTTTRRLRPRLPRLRQRRRPKQPSVSDLVRRDACPARSCGRPATLRDRACRASTRRSAGS